MAYARSRAVFAGYPARIFSRTIQRRYAFALGRGGGGAGEQISIAVLAVSRENSPVTHRAIAPVDAQMELQKWIEAHSHVQFRQPRILPGAAYPTAMTEGLQEKRVPWYKRFFRRPMRTLWRCWAMLNPRQLILVSVSGTPAFVEADRTIIDRFIGSIRLLEAEVLIGRRFTETVVSLARAWFPRTPVDVIDEEHVQFGTQSLSLAGLHRRYLASPEELSKQVRAFLTEALSDDLQAEPAASPWMHVRERVVPFLLNPAARKSHAGVVNEEWVNDLTIAYLLQSETGTAGDERLITPDDLALWKVEQFDLHEQSLRNLVVRSNEHVVEGRKTVGYMMLSLARSDRLNAARLLLPELHKKLSQHLGRTFFAAIPARDTLVAFHAADQEVLARIRAEIAEDCQRNKHPLSPKLFLVTPDGITGDPADAEDFSV